MIKIGKILDFFCFPWGVKLTDRYSSEMIRGLDSVGGEYESW